MTSSKDTKAAGRWRTYVRCALGAAWLVVTLPLPGVAEPQSGLLDVYDAALAADTHLQAATSGVTAAEAREREALAGWLPHLTATASLERARRDERETLAGAEGAREFTREQYQLRLTQPLYDRARWVRMRQAGYETRHRELELQTEQQELVVRVTESYFDVLLAKLDRDLAQREVEALEGERRRVLALYDRELASVADEREIEAALAQAESELARSEHRLETAHESLREITGQRFPMLRPLGEGVTLELPTPDDLDAWIDRAMAHNPRLQATQAALRGRRDQIALERAGHHPRLELIAGHSYFDDVDDEEDLPLGTTGRHFDETTVGLRLTVPLYEGGRVSARSRAAQAELTQLQQQTDGFRRALQSSVRSSFLDIRRGITAVRALERSVEAEETRLMAVERELELGRRSVVDLLDARRNRFEAHLALAQARTEYLSAHVALLSTTGELDRETVRWLDSLLED